MKLNSNILAMNSIRNLQSTGLKQATALERLSSGKKINRASDNAAGYAISGKMAMQMMGLKMASKNSLDGISLIQTAEGALTEVHSMLQRMRELAVQSSNDTNVQEDREAIQEEINQLTSEINRIGKTSEYNKMNMFLSTNEDGTYKPDMNISVQAGANSKQMIDIEFREMSAYSLGISYTSSGQIVGSSGTKYFSNVELSDKLVIDRNLATNEAIKDSAGNILYKSEYALDVTSREAANSAIKAFDEAINRISELRAILGAAQNRFENNIRNVDNAAENVTQSMSRIQDADMAEEMTEFTKFNILQQSGTSMLAQANQLPQMVLKLLES